MNIRVKGIVVTEQSSTNKLSGADQVRSHLSGAVCLRFEYEKFKFHVEPQVNIYCFLTTSPWKKMPKGLVWKLDDRDTCFMD